MLLSFRLWQKSKPPAMRVVVDYPPACLGICFRLRQDYGGQVRLRTELPPSPTTNHRSFSQSRMLIADFQSVFSPQKNSIEFVDI